MAFEGRVTPALADACKISAGGVELVQRAYRMYRLLFVSLQLFAQNLIAASPGRIVGLVAGAPKAHVFAVNT